MKLRTTVFTSSLLSIAKASSEGHFHHPGLRYVRFVFLDDQPNENKLGVEYEDFGAVAESAIGTPIKMRFLGESAGSHIGSIPIGHITDMTENTTETGVHQLIADGVLYAAEYPDEIDYLETAFASDKAPGISFEIAYEQAKAVVKEGITWIKNVVTRAATFVRNPAYGTRTALLALASNNSISDEDFADGLTAIANEMRPKNTNKGGNNTVEKELEELKAKYEALEKNFTKVTEEKAALETANASLTTEKDELQKKNDAHEVTLAAVAKEKLIAARTKAVAEAGITLESDEAKLQKKQEFWARMDEEGFAEYVDDLKAAAKPAKSTRFETIASASRERAVPKITGDADGGSLAELKARLGSYSRTSQDEEE